MKVTTFTVRASAEEARRWALVARYLGCRSVSGWLEEMAEDQAARWDELASEGKPGPCDNGRRQR
jgi:hypothetical protein